MRNDSWDGDSDFDDNDYRIEGDYEGGDYEDAAHDSDTIACYHCGTTIYADADVCSQCGNFLIDSERPGTGQPAWILWTAIILIVMFLGAAVVPALRLFMRE